MLWVGAALAVIAAVLLAFVPRSPSGVGQASHRVTAGSNRRQWTFAVAQIAASFVLLVGASALVRTLLALQTAQTGLDTRHVLAINVPLMAYGRTEDQIVNFYQETLRRVSGLPGVDGVAIGNAIPWRDAGNFGPGFQFSADGHVGAPGEEDPRARFRTVSPGFFAALGLAMIAGRVLAIWIAAEVNPS